MHIGGTTLSVTILNARAKPRHARTPAPTDTLTASTRSNPWHKYPVKTHVHTHIYHCRLYPPQGHPSRTAPVDTFARKRTHICVRTTKHVSSRPARASTNLRAVRTVTLTPRTTAGSPRPPIPSFLTHDTGQDQNAEAEGGQGLGPASRNQHFWGLCSSVPLRSALQAGGGGDYAEQSPPLAASPRPLAGTSERGAQVTVTSRGLTRPCWPPSFLPSQHFGLTGEDSRLFGL